MRSFIAPVSKPFIAALLACSTLALSACSSAPTESDAATGDRAPAAQTPLGPPPMTTSRELWVYTWTRKAAALKNPAGYVERQLTHAQSCVQKLDDAKAPVPGCEGEGLIAGPGLYACDNPFTAHDYGTISLEIHVRADRDAIGLQTGKFRVGPGAGIERNVAGLSKYEGFLYDFRPTDFSTRALVIRSPDLIDATQTTATDVQPKSRRLFRDHASFKCKADTPVGDLLRAWADQLDFLAITYNAFADPSGQGFMTDDGALNPAAAAAALASDVVTRSDADLNELAERLKAKYTDVEESLNRCHETDTATLRACLAQRIFVSLVGDRGTPETPTNAWKLSTIRLALVDIGVAPRKEVASLTTGPKLLDDIASRFRANAKQAARAREAFDCMRSVKTRVQANNFDQWGADPQ